MHWKVVVVKHETYTLNAQTDHAALALAIEGGLKPLTSSVEDFKVSLVHQRDYVEDTTPGDEVSTV